MFRRASLLTILALPLLLAGCGMFEGGQPLRAHIEPTQLGFEITDNGLEFDIPNVTFTNRANAPQAEITGYEVRFYGDSGAPFPDVANNLYNDGHISVLVPAGYSCPEEDQTWCSLTERRYEPRQSEPMPFVMVPGTVGTEIVAHDLTRIRAVVTFFAEQAGSNVEWSGEITVTYPVRDAE